ncbi:Bcrai1 [Botrytis cinerea B05.10]|uniref:Decapping nuclease n=1 Tax=Botryotinia fuckeliana (strain B05.10) TaxID=332648 RepID=A0A384K6Y5_BOTFB|nr:Bcrai1 [Botrytis cinerea B05.10]ATZ58569.1 Bcrai1 [Botrytis cinerea B05.10]
MSTNNQAHPQVHVFNTLPLNQFERTRDAGNAAISRPQEIAHFSYDDNHEFHLDDSSIRWYYPPDIGTDLNRGFETFRKHDDSKDEHLESLLRALMEKEKTTNLKTEADIITWRGMMTKIIASLFDSRDGFQMNATCFEGTIFVEEDHQYKVVTRARQDARQRPQPGRPSGDAMSFWGYKFETLCLMPTPWPETSRDYIENRDTEIVNNHAQYCSIVKTKIGGNALVIGGEVDGIYKGSKSEDGKSTEWLELKTSVTPRHRGDEQNFEKKLLKFWLQSFLLGVPHIIVGKRSPDGILQSVERINTAQIPGMVKRGGNNSWDGDMCINFANQILQFLKATIIGDGVWKIRRREKSMAIEVFKVEEKGHGGILSDEFVEWRGKLGQQTSLNSHVENSTVQMNGLNVTAGDAPQTALADTPLS